MEHAFSISALLTRTLRLPISPFASLQKVLKDFHILLCSRATPGRTSGGGQPVSLMLQI